MGTRPLLWLGMAGLLAGAAVGQQVREPAGEPVDLTARGADVEKVADGYRFTEGPAADAGGNVVFSDIPSSRILRFEVSTSRVEVLHEQTGRANGLMFDRQGRLVACAMGLRRLVRYEPDGRLTTLAGLYHGKRFNSPNDLDIDRHGGIYFTDPRYGPRGDMEMSLMGVYYRTPQGRIVRVVDDLVRPNGLVLSPDGRRLYVSDADGKRIYAWTVQADGRLADKQVFARVPADHSRAADGMTVDARGNVYGACLDGIRIWSPAGRLLQVIAIPQVPSNCTFAGPDGRWLYITARTALYRVKMTVRGRPPWPEP